MSKEILAALTQQFNNAQAIPFPTACFAVGWAAQTGRNRLAQGTLPFVTVKRGNRRYVYLDELAKFIESERKQSKSKNKKIGLGASSADQNTTNDLQEVK